MLPYFHSEWLLLLVFWVFFFFPDSPNYIFQLNSVQSLSRVQLFTTPWTAASQTSLSITTPRVYSNSWPSFTIVLNIILKSVHSYLVPNIKGKFFSLSPFNIILTIYFVLFSCVCPLKHWGNSILKLLCFLIKQCWICQMIFVCLLW